MLLRYYLDKNNNRIYTLEMLSPEGLPTLNAHPARFSPDDKFSEQRMALKSRHNLLPIKIN